MISDGMKCESYLRELKEGEPVWRSNSFPPGMQSVCKNCVSRYCYDPNEWRPAKPCQHCGWPVALSVRRNVPKYVVCGETCRSAVYYAHRRHPLATRACAICGERLVMFPANIPPRSLLGALFKGSPVGSTIDSVPICCGP